MRCVESHIAPKDVIEIASHRAAEARGGQDRLHDPYIQWLRQWAKLAVVRELRSIAP